MFILVTILILIIVALICVAFISIRRNATHNNQTNHYDNQINKRKLNKKIKWLKKAFNGEEEEEDCQLFFINKYDATDVKLVYELLSAKKAVEQDRIGEDYNSISFDDQDKYCEYKITHNDKLKINDTTGNSLALYEKLVDKEYKIEKLHKQFMKESNFDEGDLVAYYKAIIESKKIDEDEVKTIAKTYFTMVNQLYKLKILSRSETVNEAISKSHITQGFDESQLKKELNELLKK